MLSSTNSVRFTTSLRRISLDPAEIAAAKEREDLEAARKAAYQQGFEDASAFLEKQIAEQRAEVVHLQEETFSGIAEQHTFHLNELCALLPGLVTEMTRRVLSGIEPNQARVERAIAEVLEEMVPGERDIEIALHPADLALLGSFDQQFEGKYPGLRFVPDVELKVGDCRMRTRFGTVDGRLETKLANLSRALL